MYQQIIKKLYFWSYKIFAGSNVETYYNYLNKAQWDSFEVNQKRQAERLCLLLKHSLEQVPYYKHVGMKNKITISQNDIFNDIKKFPILTKEVLRKEFNNLYAKTKGVTYKNTSGGSTGEPVLFLQDKEMRDWGRAAKILFDEWAGRKIGEKKIILWGSERDVLYDKKGAKRIFIEKVLREKLLNTFCMNTQKMENYVNAINSFKPSLILSYTSSMQELIAFIKKEHLTVFSPKAVMTSAGVLSEELRKEIYNIFRCSIFNRYGSRETSAIACECEQSGGLHVIPDIIYFEIVNDVGQEVRPGESGDIIITLLTNFTMPLIRYKIGDRATKSSENRCVCRRGWPTINNIIGRSVDVFTNEQGDKIDGEYFTHLFYFKDGIEKFQVVQKNYNLIIINLVIDDKKLPQNFKEEITQKIKTVMGNKCELQFNFVDKIDPSPSGKYLYTISEVK